MKIEDFYNNEFVDYASYDNLRKIASVLDGQKNASRKVCNCILDKGIKEFVKVSQLGSKICEYTDYLHGSIDGIVVTLGQDFAGTNNVPLIKKRGNFGTRLVPEASASRYIFAAGSDALFKWFNPDDNDILVKQTFEGSPIEPKYYLPTYPVILINGSEGISTGFAQKILPRSFEYIKEYMQKRLSGEEISEKYEQEVFTPFFNGFNGDVAQGETPTQWEVRGKITRIAKNRVNISEVPITYSLQSYTDVLDKLEDAKKITGYVDKSDNDQFSFDVDFPSKLLGQMDDYAVLQYLKLVKTISENFTCLDENNKIITFSTAKELFDYYFAFKLQRLQARKDSLLERLSKELSLLQSKAKFVEMVQNGELFVNGKKKGDIIKDLSTVEGIDEHDGYEYLLKMPIYSLTYEKFKQLKTQAKEKAAQIKTLKKKSVQCMWLDDMIY